MAISCVVSHHSRHYFDTILLSNTNHVKGGETHGTRILGRGCVVDHHYRYL